MRLESLSSRWPAPTEAPSTPLAQAIQRVNAAGLLGDDRELRLRLDPDARRLVVQVVARETSEVLAQLPSEQVLRMARIAQRPSIGASPPAAGR